MSSRGASATGRPATVSNRASKVSEETAANRMWDVFTNLYDATTNKDGFVNVGVAENFLMHGTLLEYIRKHSDLPPQYLTYNDGGDGSRRLKTAASRFLNRHLKPVVPLEPEHLLVTNGVSAAIEHLAWAFANPGEGILLGRPHYGAFIPDMTSRPEAEVVPVSFDDIDPFEARCVTKYERAMMDFEARTGKRVRALMLCHPHNPLGRCYPRETIIELMKFCQRYQIHLISDEIYAMSVWENTIDTAPGTPPPVKFISALSIPTQGLIDGNLLHALWGMSKDFGANGLRVGIIISQSNPELMAAIKGPTLYSYVSGLSDHIVSSILEDEAFTDRYIAVNQMKLSESYAFVAQAMRDHNIEYAVGCNASFFVWVNLGKAYLRNKRVPMPADLTRTVMDELISKRVFLADGTAFGSEKPGWFRIVFSHPRPFLDEALGRIMAAIGEPYKHASKPECSVRAKL
ncbi:1-aminocyclopropane-1-carboxylate synthase [Nannizzia gypsea CBS 118893]|uniref:1-aminocyclopropane-1-carboxylate synthase n=1 Tax=Arthroderma gypseum (strain ATCC MYA-4604 / CBS 118893) TaxID=535722 RepID=E4UQT6_ARTGP|nr:1-aminocyclopropane-1-carboxylate synthase [Nannizzia gypsea CBS 118893]EFR00104.1 1-aminocyclopropane-1-carboxylate synthase [Nannizzia gypsea CBS 118893]